MTRCEPTTNSHPTRMPSTRRGTQPKRMFDPCTLQLTTTSSPSLNMLGAFFRDATPYTGKGCAGARFAPAFGAAGSSASGEW